MHALITVAAANLATANALASQFDPDGDDTFRVPVYARDSTDDTVPVAYLASPEFVTPGKIEQVREMVAGLPGSHMVEYDLSAPFNIAVQLAGWGYRTARPSL